MKLGIMQPYFFPYWGYWQLISCVDKFIIYDDVNYIKGGWINRNYILSNSCKHLVTLNLLGASSYKKICNLDILDNKAKIFKTITQNYNKRLQWGSVKAMLEDIVMYPSRNLSEYLSYGIQCISRFLSIDADIIVSSNSKVATESSGQDRIIKICSYYNSNEYINAIGGMELYSKQEFLMSGITLNYLKPNLFYYEQGNSAFIPSLSIIDILCNVNVEIMKQNLKGYQLI